MDSCLDIGKSQDPVDRSFQHREYLRIRYGVLRSLLVATIHARSALPCHVLHEDT